VGRTNAEILALRAKFKELYNRDLEKVRKGRKKMKIRIAF